MYINHLILSLFIFDLKVGLILNELDKYTKPLVTQDFKLTDILSCPIKYSYENEYKKYKTNPLGNIVDKHIKSILERFNITGYSKKVTMNNLEFYIGVDGIDNEAIYEIKKSNIIPSNIEKIPERILLQVYAYAFFLKRKIIVLIFVNDKEYKIHKIYVNKEKQKEYLEKLKEKINDFKAKKPNYDECEFCLFKNICSFYKEPEYQITKNITVNKVYRIPYRLPNEGYLKDLGYYYYFKRIKDDEKDDEDK